MRKSPTPFGRKPAQPLSEVASRASYFANSSPICSEETAPDGMILGAAQRNVWQRQCEVVQDLARNRFEVGFTTEEGNEALLAAGLPTLNSEHMDRALKGQTSDADTTLKNTRSGDHSLSAHAKQSLTPTASTRAQASLKASFFVRQRGETLQGTSDEQHARERRWREILEELGPDVVRTRFSARTSVWGDRYSERLPPNDFIVAWLAQKHADSRRTDARRFFLVALMTFSTLIATCFTLIAAWIAAYPVVCRWLPDAWTAFKRLCG